MAKAFKLESKVSRKRDGVVGTIKKKVSASMWEVEFINKQSQKHAKIVSSRLLHHAPDEDTTKSRKSKSTTSKKKKSEKNATQAIKESKDSRAEQHPCKARSEK